MQLGYLQIVNGDNIEKQLKASSVVEVNGSSPRGMIYDASGKTALSKIKPMQPLPLQEEIR